MRVPVLLASLALSASLPAAAAAQSNDFSWRGTLAAGKVVELRGVLGDISAEPASGNTVEVTAT